MKSLSMLTIAFNVGFAVGGASSTSPTSPTAAQTTQRSCDGGSDDVGTACPNVLFLNDGGNYMKKGKEIIKYLEEYVSQQGYQCANQPHGVTNVSNIENLPSDLSSYTQIWVFDLDLKPEIDANVPKWESIANWFQSGYPEKRQHVVLDGRMLSSTSYGKVNPNNLKIFANYFANLRAHGGGLVLGTDHGNREEDGDCAAYVCGINTVTEALGVHHFWGSFLGTQVAYVDVENPLMNNPLIAYHSIQTRKKGHRNNAIIDGKVFDQFVWDHSSTSETAVGLQTNGMTFYAAAFHSHDTYRAAISSTLRGLGNFLDFEIGLQASSEICEKCYVVGETATIDVSVSVLSAAPYSWNVLYTGSGEKNPLPDASTFQTSDNGESFKLTTLPLTQGNHSFIVTATDNQNRSDSTIVKFSADGYGCYDATPWYGSNPGPCFEWNVMWPCRGCENPYNPNGPSYGGGSSGGGSGGGCPPANDPDYAVWCVDGFQPCANGVPKCVSDPLNKTLLAQGACDPEPNTLCGGGHDAGGTAETGYVGGEGGDAVGGEASSGVGEEGSLGSGTDTSNLKDDRDKNQGGESSTPTVKDDDVNNEKKCCFRPFPFPDNDCDDCPEAEFKCHEAECATWSCLWWCRCYDENVDYECEDDGDDCDCGIFGKELYNVTYEELACSPYMDVQFSGPGSAKYNKQAECCRDPMKDASVCPLD